MEYLTLIGGLFGIFGAICATVVPLLILVGLGIFLYRRNQQGKAAKEAAQNWSSTAGIVLMSSVQSRRTGNSNTIYPVVVYQYVVNGQSYQSQRIKAGEQFFSVRVTGEAQATVNRYPIGAEVMVYYDPADPGESALER